MRIAHLIDSLYWGGAQKLEVTFAAQARAHAFPFTLVSLRRDENTPIPSELDALGARIFLFPSRRLLDPMRIARLVRFVRRERLSLVHTHLLYANIIGAIVGRLAGVPVVSTLHSAGTDARKDHALKLTLEGWTLRFLTQRVVAVGDVVANAHAARLGGRSVSIIPNAVDIPTPLAPAERTVIREQVIGDASRPVMIAVGRLTAAKGYLDLLDAFDLVHREHPNAVLLIVGAGDMQREIKARIQSLGVDARLLGARNDVPRLLAASDLFVSSSHWEGLQLTLLEAMASGLPVVVTSVGEAPRVLTDSNGVLVPPREPVELARAINGLLDDPARARALGEQARLDVTRRFNAAVWFERHIALYRELASVQARGTVDVNVI